MKKHYLNNKMVPRWVVLLLDFSLICCSFSFSYYIVSHFNLSGMLQQNYFVNTAIFCLVALPLIYKMRLHTGLLRYANTADLLHVFKALFLLSVIYYIMMLLLAHRFSLSRPAFLSHLLFIDFFIASSLMIMMRIMAKNVFKLLGKRATVKKTVHILIYGSDKSAILLKRALENSDEFNYKIEGFIEINPEHCNINIEQKRVYSIRSLDSLKEQKRIEQLIMINEDLTAGERQALFENCLRLKIKILKVPPVQNWLSDGLTDRQIQKLCIEDLLQRGAIKINRNAVSNNLNGKRILITGAAGSIGSEIARRVLDYKPGLVILCDQAESPLHKMQLKLEEECSDAAFKIVIADIRNKARMTELFQTLKPEIIFHAAAYKHVPLMENNPFEAIHNNVYGTKNIADLAVIFNAEKFIMISTDKAVNPTNVMGASKRIAEIYVQSLHDHQEAFRAMQGLDCNSAKTRFITTRFGNVLGSNGSVIPRFRAQIEKGGPVTVTHPQITRYFMTISEAVQLVLEAGTMGQGGEIFVFDMGQPVKIYDMAKKMIQLAGLEPGKDIDIIFSGLRPGEKLYEELLNPEETTLLTYHEKISIARVRNYAYEEVQKAIEKLASLSETQNSEAIVRFMKKLVPEFISMNSPFEALDNSLKQPTLQSS